MVSLARAAQRTASCSSRASAAATGDIELFEPYIGGRFRMTLRFTSTPGKSSKDTDVVDGRFVALVAGERVVQAIEFVSDDPAFAVR